MKMLFVYLSALLAPCVFLVQAAVAISVSGRQPTLPASTSGNNCNSDFEFKPVCGTDNKTYSNLSVLKCVSSHNVKFGLPLIDVASYGECHPTPCVCPTVYHPVCGSDNQTYSSECIFDCENKRRIKYGLPHTYILYKDSCKRPICICNDDIIPICGSDSKTYKNMCLLKCINHINQAQGKPGIRVRSYGACPVENCMCPLIIDPVCGTNKRTYSDRFLLDCENRRHEQLGLPQVEILHVGPCLECMCTEQYQPVCASDKKTYANICKLNCENRRRALYGLQPLTSTNGECNCTCTKK